MVPGHEHDRWRLGLEPGQFEWWKGESAFLGQSGASFSALIPAPANLGQDSPRTLLAMPFLTPLDSRLDVRGESGPVRYHGCGGAEPRGRGAEGSPPLDPVPDVIGLSLIGTPSIPGGTVLGTWVTQRGHPFYVSNEGWIMVAPPAVGGVT